MNIRTIAAFTLGLSLGLVAYAVEAGHTLVNSDILTMAGSGFSEDVIVAMIEAGESHFDVSIGALTELKSAGISSRTMEAMIKATGNKRETPPPNPNNEQSAMQPPPAIPMPAGMNPMATMGGAAGMQQMMAMAMNGAMMGGAPTFNAGQLPPVTLISDAAHPQLRASTAQIAHTDNKGGMPGVGGGGGGAATSLLMGLGQKALSFGAIGGSMFAGPAAGLAGSAAGSVLGSVGGLFSMGHHHTSMPKVTYVWALPGRQSDTTVANNKPQFEMAYGDLLGIDPDAYEPMLVKLVPSKDNWRLIGATTSTMGQMSPEAYDKVTEERVAVKSDHLARGQVRIQPKQPLEAGEYGLVLRALHPGKRSAGSLGGGAEASIFFSLWDFSVHADAATIKH